MTTFTERPAMWAHIENAHGADYEVCDHPACRAAYLAEVLEDVTDEQVRDLLMVQERRIRELEAKGSTSDDHLTETEILTKLNLVFEWHKTPGPDSFETWLCRELVGTRARVAELEAERDNARQWAKLWKRAASWKRERYLHIRSCARLLENKWRIYAEMPANARAELGLLQLWAVGRIDRLEALLTAEQAAAEADGDEIQAAPLPGYPPPPGYGLGRGRAGTG